MNATILHNPRCSKSRQTLALLEEKDHVDLKVIEYVKSPPTPEELGSVLHKLNVRPAAIIRRGEKLYKQLNLSDRLDDDEYLIEMMVKYPILIERPIVITDTEAAVGRPPENVLKLFV